MAESSPTRVRQKPELPEYTHTLHINVNAAVTRGKKAISRSTQDVSKGTAIQRGTKIFSAAATVNSGTDKQKFSSTIEGDPFTFGTPSFLFHFSRFITSTEHAFHIYHIYSKVNVHLYEYV